MKKNTWRKYEEFVGELYQAILSAEHITSQKNIVVEIDKKIIDRCGVERQFDVYWEYELAGITYKTVIECKDYASNISIEKVDALLGKIADIPDLKPILATKTGYQSGAQKKALSNKVDLIIVREQNDSDWFDSNGTPLIKEICINLSMLRPTHINRVTPVLDEEWAKNNSFPNDLKAPTNEIFIDDIESGKKYSLDSLSQHLSLREDKCGNFKEIIELNNSFVCHKNDRIKIKGYIVEYSVNKPLDYNFKIDFSKELVGVIEYLQKGTKKTIFKNGIIK